MRGPRGVRREVIIRPLDGDSGLLLLQCDSKIPNLTERLGKLTMGGTERQSSRLDVLSVRERKSR